mgnify:CR=1 FL=1
MNFRSFPQRRAATALLLLALLVGMAACTAVGPDHHPLDYPAPRQWHTSLDGGRQNAGDPAGHLARWWESFQDPVLVELVRQGAAGSLELAQARARVREARARRGLGDSDLFPDLTGVAAARRSQNAGGPAASLFSTGFDAGWEIDVFGGLRRGVEAAQGDLEAAQAGLDGVRVTLAAEIGLNYIEARTYQARLAAAEGNLEVQRQTFDLVHSRHQAGLGDELDLQQARYNLESTRSQIPALHSGLAAACHRLAVLAGRPPGAIQDLMAPARPVPAAPPAVAVGIPAETLRRRPDILQAERQVAAQSARIGVAQADAYPRFRLAGSVGLNAFNSNDLFQWASRTWGIGPSLSWNLFDAGATRRQIQVQTAVQERLAAAWEAAVLTALEEVENALNTYAQEQVRRDHLAAALAAARQAEALAARKYQAGLADFASVLEAQRALLSFQDQMAASQGAVSINLVKLYKALGGGWEPRLAEDSPPPS